MNFSKQIEGFFLQQVWLMSIHESMRLLLFGTLFYLMLLCVTLCYFMLLYGSLYNFLVVYGTLL